MEKRKQYLIDKDYQIKKSLTIIGFTSSILAIALIPVFIFISLNNNKIKHNNVMIIKNSGEIKQMIVSQNKFRTKFSSESTPEEVEADFRNNIGILKTVVEANEVMVRNNAETLRLNRTLIGILLLIFFSGIVALYFILIRHTHRTSGPIAAMTRGMKDLLAGNMPEMEGPRQKDDFKELYDLLKELSDQHLELQKKNSIEN